MAEKKLLYKIQSTQTVMQKWYAKILSAISNSLLSTFVLYFIRQTRASDETLNNPINQMNRLKSWF